MALENFWKELHDSSDNIRQVQIQSSTLSEIAKLNASKAKRLNSQLVVELQREEQIADQRFQVFNKNIDLFEKRSSDALASRMTMIYGLTHNYRSVTYKIEDIKKTISTKISSDGHYTLKFFGGGGHIVAIYKFPNCNFLFMDPNTGVWHCTSNDALDSLLESQIDGLYRIYTKAELDYVLSHSDPVIAV